MYDVLRRAPQQASMYVCYSTKITKIILSVSICAPIAQLEQYVGQVVYVCT